MPIDYQFPRSLLIQFAKAPELGRVKTRMQPYLSTQQSVSLHCRLVEQTYRTLTYTPDSPALAPVELWTTGRDEEGFFNTMEPPPNRREQQGVDLGMRMYHALEHGLQRYQSVVLVGSDCPFFTVDLFAEALKKLASGIDCVLGPAIDGGYVLIGLSRIDLSLFTGITWSTDQVLAQTRSRLRRLSWQWQELTALPDIDTPEDLTWFTELSEYKEFVLTP